MDNECRECGEPCDTRYCVDCALELGLVSRDFNDEGEPNGFDSLDDGEPMGSHDLSDDADALASAGFGTDEDYGYFGDSEY